MKKGFDVGEEVEVGVRRGFGATASEKEITERAREKSRCAAEGVPEGRGNVGHQVEKGATGFEGVDESEHYVTAQAALGGVVKVGDGVGPIELGSVFGMEPQSAAVPGGQRAVIGAGIQRFIVFKKCVPYVGVYEFVIVVTDNPVDPDTCSLEAAQGLEPRPVGARDKMDFRGVTKLALDLEEVNDVAEENQVDGLGSACGGGCDAVGKMAPLAMHGVDSGTNRCRRLAAGEAFGP